RLNLLFANLPIANLSLWSHPNPQVIANQANSLLNNWRRASLSPEQIGGSDWRGWIGVFPEGGAQAIAQQGNRLWLVEGLSRDACLTLLNSALAGQSISKIDSLLPPLQPDILVEDIGKTVGFDFANACFFAAKDDIKSLALASELSNKLGGKVVRLEEVNRYNDIVIIGSTAL
ncbi:MAG: hypothetical protein H5T69_21530, partial [Chloroflexi bacterium]|nr:hypothetical protein [Chloroflexota bacterium]